LTFRADITDDKAMHQIAAEVGSWDVFILNAAHLPNPASIASADLSDYWKAYEVRSSTVSSLTSILPNPNPSHD
jgi:NADP-dependent 3-hydroxy acid dehydrogenase YdfG